MLIVIQTRGVSLSLSLSNAAPTSAVRSRARTSCGPLSTTHNLEGSPRRFSQVARATVIHQGHPSSRDTPGKAPSTIPRSRATLRANESRSLLYFFTSVSPTFLASPLRCLFSLCPSLSRSRALSLSISLPPEPLDPYSVTLRFLSPPLPGIA